MPVSRRNVIKAGLGALGVAALPEVAAATTALPALPAWSRTAHNLILLYLQGGPSQIDTFDPKPGRPTQGPIAAIPTRIDGVSFSEHLPALAGAANRLAVIRSLTSTEGNHDRARHLMHTGYPPQGATAHPALGSLVGLSRPSGPLPPYVAIGGPGHGAGFLGASAAPLVVTDPTRGVRNARPAQDLPAARMDARLDHFHRLQRAFDASHDSQVVAEHTAVTDKALAMSRASELAAFDLSTVSAARATPYGTSAFGRGCLMAARLVESGVSCVEVVMDGWDTHDDNFARVAALSRDLDRSLAALLDDLRASGLLAQTVVACFGDFGRTPQINARGGRGHYPRVSSALVAGGPITRGAVVGRTDADGYDIEERPVSVPDLFRTLTVALGIDPDEVRMSPQGRPIATVDGGDVITELLA